MSGILGFAQNQPQTVNLGKLKRALQLLEQRGPDDRALFLFDGSGHLQSSIDPALLNLHWSNARGLEDRSSTAMLACCRLRVEDPLSIGNASMGPAGDRVFLAYDGVVDNGPELIRDLQKLGQEVQSGSGLHVVLLAALKQWGPDCLSRIRGSFAFAAIDFHRRNLILARDAFGTRPLYYSRENGRGLFFASNIGALLEISSVARRVNRGSLYRYLVHNVMDHGEETFFAEISQVLPGSYLEVRLDDPTRTSLTHYRRGVQTPTKLTFDEAARHIRDLVTRSVAAQAGPYATPGAALSGGFDSSFVVAAFKRAQLSSRLRLYTCVPVVRSGTFSQSEEIWADLAAAGFQAPISKVQVTAQALPESFASLVRSQDEPFSSPVVFAQLQVFKAARADGVRFMLSGQGGDTLFAVSTDQVLRAAFGLACRGRLEDAADILQAVRRVPQGSMPRLLRAAVKIMTPEGLRTSVMRRRRLVRPDWLNDKWFDLNSAIIPGELGLPMLRFEDRNSMACGMLNRMPLLTTELQDFVCSLPLEYLITRNQPVKSIESAAMRGIVPNEILARKERSGFPVPVIEWLQELAPWVEQYMPEIERFPFLEPRSVRRIWGSVGSWNTSVSAAYLVWRWIFLAGWVRFFDVSIE